MVLTQLDLGFMKNLGYDRRVAAPRGLDPPFFSCRVRANRGAAPFRPPDHTFRSESRNFS